MMSDKVKYVLQNDAYSCNTFYIICSKNPSLIDKISHNEGKFQQSVKDLYAKEYNMHNSNLLYAQGYNLRTTLCTRV